MVRNGNIDMKVYTKYEITMVRKGYVTKMIFTVVRNDGNDYNCGFTDPDVKWQTVVKRTKNKRKCFGQ